MGNEISFDELVSKYPHEASALFSQALGSQVMAVQSKKLREGFNSRGFQVDLDNGDSIFVKEVIGKDVDQRREAIEANLRVVSSDVPVVHAIMGILNSCDFTKVDVSISDEHIGNLQALLVIQELINPTEFVPFVDAMARMGMKTVQTGVGEVEWMDDEKLRSLFKTSIAQLMTIHKNHVPEHFDEAQRVCEYEKGLLYILTSRERFDAVSSFALQLPNVAQTVSPTMAGQLREKMVELIDAYALSGATRVTPIHGDPWIANKLVSKDGRMRLIDPSPQGYGDPANDVVFTLSDLAFAQINRNSHDSMSSDVTFEGEYTDFAQELLVEYMAKMDDTDLPKFMALFYGYKAFVSALFDAGENQQQRAHLFYSALGCVTLANANPKFIFSFKDLDMYANTGKHVVSQILKK